MKSSFIAGGCAAASVQRTTLRQSDKGSRQRVGTSRMELWQNDLLPFSERYMGYSYFYILTLCTDLCRRRGSGGACLRCAASREP